MENSYTITPLMTPYTMQPKTTHNHSLTSSTKSCNFSSDSNLRETSQDISNLYSYNNVNPITQNKSDPIQIPKKIKKKRPVLPLNLSYLPTFHISPPNHYTLTTDLKLDIDKSENSHESPTKSEAARVDKIKDNNLFTKDKFTSTFSPRPHDASSRSSDISLKSLDASPKTSLSSRSFDATSSNALDINPNSSVSSRTVDRVSSKSFQASTKSSASSMSLDTISSKSSDANTRNTNRQKGEMKRKVYQSRNSYNRQLNSNQEQKENSAYFCESDFKPMDLLFVGNNKTENDLKFERLSTMKDYGAELFEKSLKLDQWAYNPDFLCTPNTISNSIQQFFIKTINDQAMENLFVPSNQQESNRSRTAKIIKIVQNGLISSTPIKNRLHERQDFLTNHSLSKKINTPLTKFLYNTFKELISLVNPLSNSDILLETEVKRSDRLLRGNLFKFLECIDKIKKGTYCPDGVFYSKGKLVQYNEKIKPVIFSIFGDDKIVRKAVLHLLRGWNNTAAKVDELINLVHLLTFNHVKDKISQVEHLWDEPVNHQFVGIPPPIDKIPPKEMIDHYIRINDKNQTLPIPFTINGEEPFKDYAVGGTYEPNEFFFRLLSSLYNAYGFKVTNEQKLKQEILQVLSINNWDEGDFSQNTLDCFRLLKMGCVNTAFRLNYLVKCRLGELIGKTFSLDNKNVSLNFCIDKKNPQNSFVEHIREFMIRYIDSETPKNPICAVIPTSWKVFLPICDTWSCVLRILKINMIEGIDLEIAKIIEMKLIQLMDDVSMERKMGGIKIGHNFLNDKKLNLNIIG